MKLRKIMALVLALVMAAAIAGCGGSSSGAGTDAASKASSAPSSAAPAAEASTASSDAPAEAEPAAAADTSTLVLGLAGEVATLDVQNSGIAGTGATLIRAVFENLLYFDSQTMEVLPGLAKEWEWVGDDGLTLKLTLRDDVYSSAGTHFTADDALFVLKRGAACAELGNKYGYLDVENSYTEGEYVLYLKLPKPYANVTYLLSLTCFGMYCEDDFNAVGADKWGREPIGIGPYLIKEWVSGDHATLVKRDDYWGEGYTFDTIECRFIADANSRSLALQSGDIDLAETIPVSMSSAIEAVPGLVLVPKNENRMISMILRETAVEAFADVRVRQAMNCGIDKDALTAAVTLGTGKAGNALFPSSSPYYTPDAASTYDFDKAKELLKEAGYENGFEFTVNVWNAYQDYIDMANALQGELAKLNITMNINTLDAAGFFSTMAVEETQAFILNMVGFVAEDSLSLYDGAAAFGGSNNANYINPEYDALYYEAMGELDDQKRMDLYHQCNLIIANDCPLISIAEAENLIGMKDYLVLSNADFDPIGCQSFLHTSVK